MSFQKCPNYHLPSAEPEILHQGFGEATQEQWHMKIYIGIHYPKMEWDKKVNCYWVGGGGVRFKNHTFNAFIYCNIERSYDS